MKAIGGYFELELAKGDNTYHTTPYALKGGRSALHYILQYLQPSLVYVPFYTCNALLEPLHEAGVAYSFYEINEAWEIKSPPVLNAGEYLVYVNYHDLKRDYCQHLSEQYKGQLILDCTQAFFMRGDGSSWMFNSCRKFFGVPDGSYLYTPEGIAMPAVTETNEDYITGHLIKRLNGHANEGYSDFVTNEGLCNSSIAAMSVLSERLLSQVNYSEVIAARRANYAYLHSAFREFNMFSADLPEHSAPMNYPLLPGSSVDKKQLFSQQLFIPTLWQDVLDRNLPGYDTEKYLAATLLPLPIDHRLNTEDMNRMIAAVMDMVK